MPASSPSSSRRRARVREAAHHLGVSKGFLDKLRCTGDGPAFYKIKGLVLYDLDEADRWLEQFRRTSTSDTGAGR